MDTLVIIVAAFPAAVIVGAMLAPVLARRLSPRLRVRSQDEGLEHARAANPQTTIQGNESRLDAGQPDQNPIETAADDQYFEDWMALQAKFIE